jgi:predicted RNase H-like HicB family nuclease
MRDEAGTGARVLEGSTTMNEKETMHEVELTAVIWEEDGVFVSLCPELGVTSCGDTVEDAATMLHVELYLENARETGATLVI